MTLTWARRILYRSRCAGRSDWASTSNTEALGRVETQQTRASPTTSEAASPGGETRTGHLRKRVCNDWQRPSSPAFETQRTALKQRRETESNYRLGCPNSGDPAQSIAVGSGLASTSRTRRYVAEIPHPRSRWWRLRLRSSNRHTFGEVRDHLGKQLGWIALQCASDGVEFDDIQPSHATLVKRHPRLWLPKPCGQSTLRHTGFLARRNQRNPKTRIRVREDGLRHPASCSKGALA